MSTPLIGSTISVISTSNIRYIGVLKDIDIQKSVITLQEVRCLGTENRRPDNPVQPMDNVFPSVVFKGTDIINLEVVSEAPLPPVFSDPAVLSVDYSSSTTPSTVTPAPAPASVPRSTFTTSSSSASQPISASTVAVSKPTSYAQATSSFPNRPQSSSSSSGNVGYAKPPPTAGAIPTNTNRFNRNENTHSNPRGHGHRGGYTGGQGHHQHRGGYHHHHHHQGDGGHTGGGSRFTGSGESLKGIREFGNRGAFGQPETTTGDFDMEAANERMAAETAKLLQNSNVQTVVQDDNGNTEIKPALAAAAYNKSSSFFDTLNSSSSGLRRDEEKRLNQETFGSVGLSHFTRGRGRGGYHRGGRGGYHHGRGGYNN